MRVINYILFIFAFIAMTGTASADYYYADITITNNPGIDDYQTHTTLHHRDGMASDFSNIRVYDQTGTGMPYCIEDVVSDTSATLWYQIDSDTSTVQVRWGIDGETVDESNPNDIYDLYDTFDGTELNTGTWSLIGSTTASVSGGYVRLYGSDGHRLVSNADIPNDAIIETTMYIESADSTRYCGVSVRDQDYRSYAYSKGYLFTYYPGASSRLHESSGAGMTLLDTGDSVAGNTPFTRVITLDGNSISDANGLGASDDTYASGKLAFGASISIYCRVYDVKVRKYANVEPVTVVGLTQIYSDEEPEEPDEDDPTLVYGNHVITHQGTTIWINTTESTPITWTVDGVVNSETGQNLSISFEKAGNHYVSANDADNFVVTVKRALATGSIEELDEGNFENITIDLDDGDWEGFAGDSMASFTDLIGRSFWLILFVLPFALNWKKQEGLTIPSIMALVVGVLVIGFIPATYHTIITVAVILAFAVNLNGLTKDRM